VVPITEIQADVEAIRRRGLFEFFRRSWAWIDPAKYMENWHHAVICKYLEKLFYGEIRNLLIMVPPGSTKSILVSVVFPAWVWTIEPAHKFLAATYGGNLHVRDARKHRDLVNSKWYQDRWPNNSVIPYQNTHAATDFLNTAKGERYSTTVGGGATGRHADTAICDDLNKAQSALSGAASLVEFEAAWEFFSVVLPTRAVNLSTFRKVMIAQSLHEMDVPERWKKEDKTITVISLPMNYNSNHPYVCPEDPRKEGELLWPDKFSKKGVKKLRKTLGPINAAAQLDQLPSPTGGAIIKRSYMTRFWTTLPKRFDQMIIAWDVSFKGGPKNDFVAGCVLGRKESAAYLLAESRDRMDIIETMAAIRHLSLKYPQAMPVLVEDAANGPAVVALLKSVPGLILEPHGGGVYARVNAVLGVYEADLILPDPTMIGYDWVLDWIEEHSRYKGSKNDIDDRVSASSLALVRLFGLSNFENAMESLKSGFSLY
jgi:predicted phage terminase large subunit-like protein